MNQIQEGFAGTNRKAFIPLFILFLLLLNCILKFYGIGYSSFWIDEAYSVSEAQRSITGIFQDCAATDNPPFYFILLHCWCKVFGITENAVRSMSAVFSIASVLLLFYFARKNLSLATAIFVSLIFSLSNQHLFYAQETRNYALVFLLTLISAIYYSKLFSEGKIKSLIFLTLINILLIYTHYIAGFLVACEGIVALIFFRSHRKFFFQILLSCILVILMMVPWISNVLKHIPEEGKFWLQKPTFYNFKGLYIDFAGNKIVTVLMFGIIALGSYSLYRQRRKQLNLAPVFNSIFFITWAFVVPIIVYMIAFYRPVFLTRYLLYCSIGFYLSTGLSLEALKLKPQLKFSIAILLLFCMTFSLELHPEREEQWREAVDLVKRIKSKNDLVIVSVSYTNNVFSYYYDINIFRQYNDIDELLKKENIFSMSTLDEASFKMLPLSGKIILIQSHQVDDDPQNTVMTTLLANTRKIVTADYNKVQVTVFDKFSMLKM
ncbi:MAG: glycosyltransferase family 39 protein [Bacteroidota bacterium]